MMVSSKKAEPTTQIGASCGLPIIVVEHTSEMLFTPDAAHLGQRLRRLDQFVPDALVIAPVAIVIDKDRDRGPGVFFTEGDKPALFCPLRYPTG
jgi:hypothetical protein